MLLFLLTTDSLGESGCKEDYHCEGGALCQENVCRCPKETRAIHNYRRCAKLDGKNNNYID